MEEMLLLLIQAGIELIGFVFSLVPFELLLYLFEWDGKEFSAWKVICLFLVGLLLGVGTVLIFPHSLIHLAWLRVAMLFVAPLLAGGFFYAIARLVSEKNDDILPRRHFWCAFAVCLGIVLIRFAYAIRG